MRYVRIKTGKEFFEAFGEDWKNQMGWPDELGRWFGKSIPYFSEERCLYNGFFIYKHMVTDKWAKDTYVECLRDGYTGMYKGNVSKIVETKSLNNSLCFRLENGCFISGRHINHFRWLGEKTEPRKVDASAGIGFAPDCDLSDIRNTQAKWGSGDPSGALEYMRRDIARKYPLSIHNSTSDYGAIMGRSSLKDAADAMMKEPIKTTINKGIWEHCRELDGRFYEISELGDFSYLRGLRDIATTPKFLKQIHKIEIKKRKSERRLNLKFR